MGFQGLWTGQFFVFVLLYFGPESTFGLRDAFNAGLSTQTMQAWVEETGACMLGLLGALYL